MITEFIVDSLERGPQEFLSSEPPLPVEHSKGLASLVLQNLRIAMSVPSPSLRVSSMVSSQSTEGGCVSSCGTTGEQCY